MTAWVDLPDYYKIDEIVRRRNYLTVLRALDRRDNRMAAIKIYHPLAWLEPDEAARRIRQAEEVVNRLSDLSHPNLAGVYEAGHIQGAFYVAREWVDGISLRELLARRGVLTFEKTHRMAVQAAGALDALTNAGLEHGSLHAGNVIMERDGTVRVTDAALSRAVWHFPLSGYTCRLSVKSVRSNDLESLAALVYKALTGRTQVRKGSNLRDDSLPEAAGRALHRVLAGRQGQYATAGDFAASLLCAPRPDLLQLAWRPAAAIGLFSALATTGGYGFTDQPVGHLRPSDAPKADSHVFSPPSIPEPALSEDDRLTLRLVARRLGVAALAQPSIADLLGISEQQRSRIVDCLAEQRKRIDVIVNAAAEGSASDTGATMQALRDATNARIIMLLDEAQRAFWQKIVSAPLTPDEPAL
jgi:serine/threonine protein kinase